MRRYLLIALKGVPLIFALTFSFELLLLRKVADFFDRRPKLVTGTDPVGAKDVVRGGVKALTWLIDNLRGYIAIYVRRFHPLVWHRLRNYLRPRR